jgi:hypothetical protein
LQGLHITIQPQIKQACLQRRFYKLHVLVFVNKLDLCTQLEGLKKLIDDTLPFPSNPSNTDEAKQLLHSAQKYVRDIMKKAAAL